VDSDTDPLKEAYAKVHHYSTSTGSGTLRSHLLKSHLEAWVLGCQKQGLQLKGKEGEEALARFTGVPLQHQAQAHVPFSQEVFCDALVKFTVATDQVSFFFCFLIHLMF
jgi:hypothetical protein